MYKDSTQSTYKLVYTKTTNVDKLIKVAFNKNTVKSVSVGNTELAAEQYKVTTDGMRTKLSAEDLETEPLSKYSFIGVDEFYKNFEERGKLFKKYVLDGV